LFVLRLGGVSRCLKPDIIQAGLCTLGGPHVLKKRILVLMRFRGLNIAGPSL